MKQMSLFITKSSMFVASLRAINRLDSAFITLRWLGLIHICIQVIDLRKVDAVESISKF